jgi:hypothetical protein
MDRRLAPVHLQREWLNECRQRQSAGDRFLCRCPAADSIVTTTLPSSGNFISGNARSQLNTMITGKAA